MRVPIDTLTHSQSQNSFHGRDLRQLYEYVQDMEEGEGGKDRGKGKGGGERKEVLR